MNERLTRRAHPTRVAQLVGLQTRQTEIVQSEGHEKHQNHYREPNYTRKVKKKKKEEETWKERYRGTENT